MANKKLTKLGPARLGTFMDWAKRQVLSESPTWVLVKTPNGTARWELPKKKKASKRNG